MDVDGSPPTRRRRSVSGDCFVACAYQWSGFAVGASSQLVGDEHPALLHDALPF
tara:strand:+ start:1047 stop:1208 length:162 start_codon:yes stop_codon:yes gene_type:complete